MKVANFPLDTEDSRREELTTISDLYHKAHWSCFDQCRNPTDLPFVSIPEGKCYRNCITKMMYFLPTLHLNLKDTGFVFQEMENDKLRAKLGKPRPDLRL